MVVRDFGLHRQRAMDSMGSGHLGPPGPNLSSSEVVDDVARRFPVEEGDQLAEEAEPCTHRLGRALYLSDLRHDADQSFTAAVPVPEPGVVSRWRMKDRMKTGYVALAMCLNIGVDPPDVIKISPCARMECWIDPLSTTSSKALDAIGKTLQAQYERWQPRAKYKVCLDPTVDEVKKLCLHCRKSARNERVLFHYNGHGVPRPTINGEIWLFNKHFTQYIPLNVYELESCLGNPSIYVFDCSAAGMIVNAFCERPDYGSGGGPSMPSTPVMRDCILLAACDAHETLPQNSELPADVFTACLTTPIKIALRWFCPRSLLSLHPDLIDQIPGRQNDRKTPLGELNWIFTAITDTIAWNVLPRDLFQRLFRQDLLVASLFRNFLLAERIMRDANCCPQSFPRLPSTHQHSMWHAWDMAAEICLSQLPILLSDPTAVFQPSPFFTEQLTAFEVWLEHGSEMKKPPEQLPIVLQVLLSQSHRFRALVLLGRFLDMGAWAVDLALSVGIFPYVLKLLQTTATDLRQILVFIWTKILALDKWLLGDFIHAPRDTSLMQYMSILNYLQSRYCLCLEYLVIGEIFVSKRVSCQVDLVKDGGHAYFIQFLRSPDIHPEQRAMAAFVLAVIVDGHPRGQEACIYAKPGLIGICLSHIHESTNVPEGQPEPLLLQWLCLCLGKLWDGSSDGLTLAFQDNAPAILGKVLSEPQPEVRAAATYALGTLVKVGSDLPLNNGGSDDEVDEATEVAEQVIARCLLKVLCDGSPLVRAELAIALARLASSHNGMFRLAAAAYLKPPSHSTVLPASGAGLKSPGGYPSPTVVFAGSHSDADQGTQTIDGGTPNQPAFRGVSSSGSLEGSAGSAGTSPLSGSQVLGESAGFGTPNNVGSRSWKRSEDGNVYVQCVTAVYALARDPFPRVACLGRQVLRIMGVESAQIVLAAKVGANRPGSHQRNSSVPALPPTPSIAGILHRSTSWVASTSGNLASTWRSSTPPPSPPTRQALLGGPPGGLRRAASMDMSAALNAPWDTPRPPVNGVQALSPAPSTRNANTGLADAAGMLTPQGLSAVNHESADPASLLPESTFYRWSFGHFSRPLLEPVHDDEEENLARRERREKEALNGIDMCRHSSVSKVSDQIASWDTGSEMGTKAVLLHPFKPLICIADDKETIRIWDYEEAAVVNTFDNHNTPDKGVSKLCLLNELDDSLLLVASSDGSVRVWKDYTQTGNHRLATAWQTVQGHKPGSRSISAVVDWHQMSGYLYASGQISWIMVWDLDRELLLSTVSSHSDSSVSAIAACQAQNAHVVTGCGDGSVRLYDIRSRDMLVCAMKPHAQKVVGLDFQPGMDFSKIISASPAGDLKFLDMRKSSAPYLEVEAHKGHLTTLTVHRHAPVIATGSGKHLIKAFSTSGEQLSMVRYHNSFLGQRIGPVSALGFHPYKVLLAAGAVDSLVSVYAGESVQGG